MDITVHVATSHLVKKLGEDDPDTLETMHALASLYYASGRSGEAETLRLFVLNSREELLGVDNLESLGTVLDMGMLYSGRGDNERTLELYDLTHLCALTVVLAVG